MEVSESLFEAVELLDLEVGLYLFIINIIIDDRARIRSLTPQYNSCCSLKARKESHSLYKIVVPSLF